MSWEIVLSKLFQGDLGVLYSIAKTIHNLSDQSDIPTLEDTQDPKIKSTASHKRAMTATSHQLHAGVLFSRPVNVR